VRTREAITEREIGSQNDLIRISLEAMIFRDQSGLAVFVLRTLSNQSMEVGRSWVHVMLLCIRRLVRDDDEKRLSHDGSNSSARTSYNTRSTVIPLAKWKWTNSYSSQGSSS
jgi:hypothetical protein